MSSGTKLIGITVAAAAIIVASLWLGRQSQPKSDDPNPLTAAPVGDGTATGPSNSVIVPRPTNRPPPTGLATNVQPTPTSSIGTAPPATTNLITDWNEKIDEALKSGAEDREVAKTLLKSFPRFPKDGQVEAVQHISNLLPDEDYPELGKLMEDASLPEDVLDELIMDLLNRPNKIMLPELLKVAKNPQHVKAGEAKDFLELYLEEDFGADWNTWQIKMEEWLKANPE